MAMIVSRVNGQWKLARSGEKGGDVKRWTRGGARGLEGQKKIKLMRAGDGRDGF
jgi:hypothetical protein